MNGIVYRSNFGNIWAYDKRLSFKNSSTIIYTTAGVLVLKVVVLQMLNADTFVNLEAVNESIW